MTIDMFQSDGLVNTEEDFDLLRLNGPVVL